MVDFFSDPVSMALVGLIFVLFIVFSRRMFSIVTTAAWIAVLSILFPILMRYALGFDMPTDANSILFFMAFGLGIYLLYVIGKGIYRVFDILEKAVKIATLPARKYAKEKKERAQKKIEAYVEKKEEEEKKLKRRKEKD